MKNANNGTTRGGAEQATFSSCDKTIAKDEANNIKAKTPPQEWMSVLEHALCSKSLGMKRQA